MIPDSYFDEFETQKYRNKNPVQRHLIRRFVAELTTMFVEANPVSSVLEIGVGEGFLSGFLSTKFPEKSFTGIDLSESDIARVKRRFPGVDAHVMTAYDVAKLGKKFDLVICAEVLEHLETPETVLREILALSPKHVLLSVPHEPFFMLSNLLRGKNVTRLGNDIDHINHWNRRSFRKLLTPHLTDIQIRGAYPWILASAKPR